MVVTGSHFVVGVEHWSSVSGARGWGHVLAAALRWERILGLVGWRKVGVALRVGRGFDEGSLHRLLLLLVPVGDGASGRASWHVAECVGIMGGSSAVGAGVGGGIVAGRVALRTARPVLHRAGSRTRILRAQTVAFGAAAGTAWPSAMFAVLLSIRLGVHVQNDEVALAVENRDVERLQPALASQVPQRFLGESLAAGSAARGLAEFADAGEVLGTCAGAVDVDFV